MSLNIVSVNQFNKELKALYKRYKNIGTDIKHLRNILSENPKAGIALAHNCYKIRLANSSVPTGKSGGFRVIYYYIDEDGLKSLWDNNQVLLTYCDANGNDLNPNGSVDSIAGVCNKEKNIFGLMPHPERAMEQLLGSDDGVKMLEGFLA